MTSITGIHSAVIPLEAIAADKPGYILRASVVTMGDSQTLEMNSRASARYHHVTGCTSKEVLPPVQLQDRFYDRQLDQTRSLCRYWDVKTLE